MKVGLLSHRGGNIGHDMMATGFEVIVRDALGPEVQIEHIEQHHPLWYYPAWYPIRYLELIPHQRMRKLKEALMRENLHRPAWKHMRRLSWSVAIACGGPVINPQSAGSPEMKMVYHFLPGMIAEQGIPVLDCGVGTCYPLERVPERLEGQADIQFYEKLFSYTTLSLVRDRLAEKLWGQMGRPVHRVVCGAIAAGKHFQNILTDPIPGDRDKFIGVNYQLYGANEDWGQGVDTRLWRETIRGLVHKLQTRHRVAFICHSQAEHQLAREADANVPRFFPRSIKEYASMANQIKAAVVSRLHAAIPLAGMGIPSVVVGTDTRLWAADEIGLKTIYVKQATVEALETLLEGYLTDYGRTHEQLLSVRNQTIQRYGDFIKSSIKD